MFQFHIKSSRASGRSRTILSQYKPYSRAISRMKLYYNMQSSLESSRLYQRIIFVSNDIQHKIWTYAWNVESLYSLVTFSIGVGYHLFVYPYIITLVQCPLVCYRVLFKRSYPGGKDRPWWFVGFFLNHTFTTRLFTRL